MTQSITVPPAWHAPRQCHRFLAGVITSDGVLSSWKGQQPIRSEPCFLKATPRASAKRCTAISTFSLSTTCPGMRAIGFLLKTCQDPERLFLCLRIVTAYCTIPVQCRPLLETGQDRCTRTGYIFLSRHPLRVGL